MAKGKYRLFCDGEVIQEAFVRYNGALGYRIGTIGPAGGLLEEAMPMLRRRYVNVPNASQKKRDISYDRSHQVQGSVLKLILDVNLNLVALGCVKIEMKREKMPMDPTFFTRITGPGKTPSASVALGCTGSDTNSNSSRGKLTCARIHLELSVR
jgi:hypothetical protein